MTNAIEWRQSKERHGAVRRVLVITLCVHLMVAALKLAFGYWSNIVSLQADGFHTLFDALSNIIGLIALGMALQPPDPEHPYGHHKLEVVASLAIGVMILLGLMEIGRGVWSSILKGTDPQITIWAFGVAIFATCSSATISLYERRAARKHDSMILEADANHTLSDALGGAAVIAGMLLYVGGWAWGDVAAATVVMGIILWTALRVLKEGLNVLIDASLLDADTIRRVVEEIEAVRSCHYVRSRGLPGRVHLDLHLTLDPQMRLSEAGEVLLEVKAHLRESFPELEDILIQIEPHNPVHYQDVPANLV